MSIKCAMTDLIRIYKEAAEKKLPAAKIREQVTELSNRTNCGGKLVREQFAYNTLHDVLFNQFYTDNLSLAYEYNGVLYSTYKQAPCNQNVEYLYTLGLTCDDWNKMKKVTVYHDFTVYDDEPLL